MGFPSAVRYGIIIPTLILDSLHILALLKILVSWFLSLLDLLVRADDESWQLEQPTCTPSPPPPSSKMIKKTLTIIEFGDLLNVSEECKQDQETVCAVCLCCIERRHKVRELYNCRHVFHKCCLDKWVDQGHHTCPLCRSSLVPQKAGDFDTDESWLVDRISYLFAEDLKTEVQLQSVSRFS